MTPMTNDQKAAQKAANVASRVAGSSRRKLVTVLSLDNPKRATKATARPDPDCRGLQWITQPSGLVTPRVGYRIKGQARFQWFGLDPWQKGGGETSLAEIRERAREIKRLAKAGIDPKAREREKLELAREVERKSETDTVDALLDRYVRLDVEARALRSAPYMKRTFDRLVRPRIGRMVKYSVKRRNIVALLDEIAAEAGLRMADYTLAILNAALNWEARRDEDFVNPIVRGMARLRAKDQARRRVLSDEEIRDLWSALDTPKVPATIAAYVKALVYLGPRRSELSQATWEQIHDDLWTLPAALSKTGDERVTPLPAAVIALLGERSSGYVFSTTDGARPISGFSKFKRAIDEAIAEIRKHDGRPPMPPWVYHDLRRSCRSLLARAGVSNDVAERVLGHALQGVRHTYDLHTYTPQKAAALEKLAALVDRILNPPAGNVVDLAAQRA